MKKLLLLPWLLCLLLPAPGLAAGSLPPPTSEGAASASASAPAAARATATAEDQAALERAAESWKAGRREEARLALSRLLQRAPDFPEAQRDLVDLLLEDSPPAEVANIMRDRLDSVGRSTGPLFGLAYALARAGTLVGLREAAPLLQDAMTLAPGLVILVLTKAEIHAALDQLDQAAELYGEAIRLQQSLGDWEAEAKSWIRRAQLLHIQGGPRGKEAYAAAIERAIARADRKQEALARNGLGGLLFTRGEFEEALASFQAARIAAEQGQDGEGVLAALQNEALVHEELWQDKQALEKMRQVVEQLDRANKPLDAALARLKAGQMLGRLGILEDAKNALMAALHVFKEQDQFALVGEGLMAMGRVLEQNDQPREAIRFFDAALEIRRQLAELVNDHRPLAETLLELGALEADQLGEQSTDKQAQAAVAHLREAYELASRAGERQMIVRTAQQLSRALLRTGRLKEVAPLLGQIQGLGDDEPFLSAQLAAARDQLDEAIRLGEAAADPALALSMEETMERYGLLLHLYYLRGKPGDERKAFGLAVAGRSAHIVDQLYRMRVRIEAGVSRERLTEQLRFAAQEDGITRVIDNATSPEVEQSWRERLTTLRRERAAWAGRLLHESPAWTLLQFPAQVRVAAETLELPEGQVHIHALIGGIDSLFFVLRGKTLELVPIQGSPSRDRVVELLTRIVRDRCNGAQEIYFSPPPGGQTFDWGYKLSPSPITPVLFAGPSPATSAEAASVPILDLVTPIKGLFETPRTDQRVQVKLTREQLKKGADLAVEMVARGLLYAGAREVEFLLPGGRSLKYVAR